MTRLALALTLAASSVALAGSDDGDKVEEGIPLVITVVDSSTGRPIPFATVREKQERDLKMVDRATGQIAITALYPSYNDTLPLKKGMELDLEVTAAAYEPKEVSYTMRRRRNRILIPLSPMEIPANVGKEPVFQFGRDRSFGGQEIEPDELEKLEREMEARRKARESPAEAGGSTPD